MDCESINQSMLMNRKHWPAPVPKGRKGSGLNAPIQETSPYIHMKHEKKGDRHETTMRQGGHGPSDC